MSASNGMSGLLGVLILGLTIGNGIGHEVVLLNQYGPLTHGHGAARNHFLFWTEEPMVWENVCWYGKEIYVGYTSQ